MLALGRFNREWYYRLYMLLSLPKPFLTGRHTWDGHEISNMLRLEVTNLCTIYSSKRREDIYTYTRLALFHILETGPRNLTPFIHQAVSQIKAEWLVLVAVYVYIDTRESGHPL